jgi:capsular polysaccharide transport system permease protein
MSFGHTDSSAVPPPLPARPRGRRGRRFASFRTISALILREMSTTYGRSAGGYLWAVLEPVAGIWLLTLVFSLFLRRPALGVSFPLFYATGMMPFLTFTGIAGKVAQSLTFSKQLLAYPGVTWADAIIARFLLNALTEAMVCYLVFSGIMLFEDTRVIVDLPVVGLSLLMSAALALGMGTLNCFLFTRFPLWQRAWSVLMRPMFLISGVMFLYQTVPEPMRDALWYNPLVHVVGMMRHGFYATYDAEYVSPLYIFAISGVLLLTGAVFLRRYHRDLLNT